MSECEHAEIFWYDKHGLGLTQGEEQNADHGRCVKCWEVIMPPISWLKFVEILKERYGYLLNVDLALRIAKDAKEFVKKELAGPMA